MDSPSRACTTALILLVLLSSHSLTQAAESWTPIDTPSYRIPAPAVLDGAVVDIGEDFEVNRWNGSGWDRIHSYSKGDSIPTPPGEGGSWPTAACGVGNRLYVAGGMTIGGGGYSAYRELHLFSSTGWQTLGSSNCYDYPTGCASAEAMFALDGVAYVGRGTSEVQSVRSHDGTSWQILPPLNTWESADPDCVWEHAMYSPCNRAALVWAMGILNGELYAAGDFVVSEGNEVYRFARLRAGSWSSEGLAMHGLVFVLETYQDKMVVAGEFPAREGTESSSIALFDGENWWGLGQGIEGRVICATTHEGQLYVGGNFTQAGGEPAGNVAAWDGATWRVLPTLPGEKATHLFSTRDGLMAVAEETVDLNWRRFLYCLDGSVETKGSSWGALKARTRQAKPN